MVQVRRCRMCTLDGRISRNTIHDTIVILRTARNTGRRVCFIRCLLNFTTGHYALDSGKTRGNNNNARFNRLHVPDTSAMPRFRFPYDRSHAKNTAPDIPSVRRSAFVRLIPPRLFFHPLVFCASIRQPEDPKLNRRGILYRRFAVG